MPRLDSFGSSASVRAAFASVASPTLHLGRVVEEQREAFLVALEASDLLCSIAGRLRHTATDRLDVPVVGDWVGVEAPPPGSTGRGRVACVLPRASVLIRKEVGRTGASQPVAANVDVVWIATSANLDFNEGRLERWVTLAWESGAQPVVLLTKIDLVADAADLVARAEASAPGVPVVGVSAVTGAGLDVVAARLAPGRTAALVGSSGVGKSTLVNRLLGEDVQRALPLTNDRDKGVHTTTSRRLLRLPGGALLVDTPGMREVGLTGDEGGVDTTFEDVAELATHCRFRDCSHAVEPGCAVAAARRDGSLDERRWASYEKLRREAEWIARKNDPAAASHQRKVWKKRVADSEAIRRLHGTQ